MAKTLISNRINGKTRSFAVPTDATNAEAFATGFLDGEYAIYSLGAEVGTETETGGWDVSMQVKNSTTGEKTYFSMIVKSTVSEEDIFAAVKGMTINGVVVDSAFITSMKSVTF